MSEYKKQAEQFLKDTDTTFKAEFLKHGHHFGDNDEERDIYLITLTRGGRTYSFNFGQSIAESGFKLMNTNTNREAVYTWFDKLTFNHDRDEKKLRRDVLNKFGAMGCLKIVLGVEPTAYSVLACLSVFDGDFAEFCGDFGYNEDSIKADKTFRAVQEETKNLRILWSDSDLEKLHEIQ